MLGQLRSTAQYGLSVCQHPIFIVYLVLYLFKFCLSLVEVPRVRLIEQALCEKHYQYNHEFDFSHGIPEQYCKLDTIQSELAMITGVRLSLDAVPGVLTAAIFGAFADKHGRKPTLRLIVLGELLALLFTPLVCLLWRVLPLELTWASSAFLFIGGGDRMFTSLLMTVISDSIPYGERTKFLYFLGLTDSLASMSAPPIEAWTLSYTALIPFGLATAVYLLVVILIRTLPETQPLPVETDMTLSEVEFSRPLIPQAEAGGAPERATYDSDNDSNAGALSPVADDEEGHTHRPEYGSRPFRETIELLLNPKISIVMFCFLSKRIGFTSENFVPQYVSEKFHMDLRQTPWFPWSQSLSSLTTLGIILPTLTTFLRKREYAPRLVDYSMVIASLSFLSSGLFLAWAAGTPVLFAAAVFICGFGEGAAPSLAGLASSFVEPYQNARLFAGVAAADNMGRVISGPLLGTLYSAGRHANSEPTGVIFLVASCIFAFALLLTSFIGWK